MTLTNYGYTGHAMVVNRTFRAGLPADVCGALVDAEPRRRAMPTTSCRRTTRRRSQIRRSGRAAIVTPAAPELDRWQRAMVPLHREESTRVGEDVIDASCMDTGFDASA